MNNMDLMAMMNKRDYGKKKWKGIKMQNRLTQERIDHGVLMRHFSDARIAQLVALFGKLDDRGQANTLALLATAVKLHPRVAT